MHRRTVVHRHRCMRYHQSSDPKWYTKYELFESGVANGCVGNTQTISSNNRCFFQMIFHKMKWNLLLGQLTQLLGLIFGVLRISLNIFRLWRDSNLYISILVTACILSLGGTGSNAIEARNFLVFLKKDCNVYSEKEYSFKLCKDSEEIVYNLMYFTYVVVKIRWYQTVDSKFDSSSKLYTSDGYWRADLIRQPTDRNQRVLFIAGWAS